MLHFLIAAALAATAPESATSATPSPTRPDAKPAIWVVNDEDTIIYLFGTFHALDGKADWFNDEVRTAFAGSQELVLEALVPDIKDRSAPKKVRGPMAARAPGGDALPALAGSASFLTNTRQVMAAGRSQGLRTDQGADAILRRAAEAAGMPVGALETVDFQLGMMNRMPAAPGPTSPGQALAVHRQLATVLAFLQAAWNRGDVDSLAPMLEQMRVSSPLGYQLMFRERNRRWAGWIANRLETPGTVFVAVGAGHLAGPDSVQHKLADRNIRSARLN